MLQPIESPPASLAAAVGGFHDPRAAARDHGEAALRDAVADLPRSRVVGRVGLDARRPEDRHGQADAREHVEAVDELAHDAQHAPRIGVDEAGILLALQEPFVGRPHALLGRPLGGHAADAAMIGHTLSLTRIVSASAAASTLPPESTTPMRSPGTAPAAIAAIAMADVGSISSLVVSQTSASAAARGVVADELDARTQLAQHREGALSICTVRAPSAIVEGA